MGSAKTEEPWGPAWPVARAALAWSIGHLKLNREHVHILGDGRDPFCPLTGAKMGRGLRSTRRWLSRFLKMVAAASISAPTPEMVPTSALVIGSSYRLWIRTGSSGATAQRWRRNLAMVARFWGLKGLAGWSLYRGKVQCDTEGLQSQFYLEFDPFLNDYR
jgi:hypothetical protein